MPERRDELLHNRREKLKNLRQQNIDPYPPFFRRTSTVNEAITRYLAGDNAQQVNEPDTAISVAGRIMALRVMGKNTFIDLKDGSGKIQLHLKKDILGQDYELIKDLDVGDFLGASGHLFRTRTGEITVETGKLTVLSKSLRPLPENWHGLKDVERRYRQRYIDLIANAETMPVFILRSKIIRAVRSFLDGRGFVEVDTPVLVPIAAGALARPFITHHNTLDEQLYLRIATELYLKRLIVGGFDKVYEIGRVFRNEGVDQDHNPEFTLLESYEAYANYHDVMTMVEDMISSVAIEVLGSTRIQYGQNAIDLTPPWRRVSLREELHLRSGVYIDEYPSASALMEKLQTLGIVARAQESRGRLIDKLLGVYVEPGLIQPTFVTDYP